jgi:hypothetical protein
MTMAYDTNKHTNESILQCQKLQDQFIGSLNLEIIFEHKMNINMIKEQNLYGNASTLMCKILQNLKRTHQLIPNFKTQNEVEGLKKPFMLPFI